MDFSPQRGFGLQKIFPKGAWRFVLVDGAWFGLKPAKKDQLSGAERGC